jgi:hypothetical protein
MPAFLGRCGDQEVGERQPMLPSAALGEGPHGGEGGALH